MIRVKVTIEPIRARARARLMRRTVKRARFSIACGACLGLAMTLARHEAPAPQIVHMVRTIETTAPARAPEAPSRVLGVPHVPETSAGAWDILEAPHYPDGFIAERRPRTSPKPAPKRKAKD